MEEDDERSFSSVVSVTNKNLSQLSRNVAVTASVLVSGSELASLSSPNAYHRAMSNVTTYNRRLVASKIRENTPRQAITQSLISRLGGGIRAPQLPEELLIDIPEPRASHSLYQAYVGSNDQTGRALSIRKEAAASELVDIDEKIANLKAMRRTVFERIADVERVQSGEEPSLQHFYPAGEKIKSFQPQSIPVKCVDFNSPFGQLALAYAGTSSSIELFELNGSTSTKLRGAEKLEKNCLVVCGSEPVVACGAGNNIYMWHNSDPEPSALVGHVGPVVGVSLDGESVVSTSQDSTVRHWDEKIGRCVTTIDCFEYGSCRAVQHVGSALATGLDDGVVRLWDLRTSNASGPQRELIGGHTRPVTALHFTGLELVSGSEDGSVRAWDLRNGQISHAEAYSGPVASLAFDNTKIVTSVVGETGVCVLSRPTKEHRITAIEDSVVTTAQYMKGYLVTGRESGEVGVYAV